MSCKSWICIAGGTENIVAGGTEKMTVQNNMLQKKKLCIAVAVLRSCFGKLQEEIVKNFAQFR
jgi:hypothetical protein